jgi:hypothetical protein
MRFQVVDVHDNGELRLVEQNYGDDPLAKRESDLYGEEFVMGSASSRPPSMVCTTSPKQNSLRR